MPLLKSPSCADDLSAFENIYIYGAGGTAKIVLGILSGFQQDNFRGFIQTSKNNVEHLEINRYRVVEIDDYVKKYHHKNDLVLICSVFIEEIANTLESYEGINYASGLVFSGLLASAEIKSHKKFCEKYIKNNVGTALDIGANTGINSILYSLYSDCVYSFEPNSKLEKMFQLNTFSREIHLNQVAVSDSLDKEKKFLIDTNKHSDGVEMGYESRLVSNDSVVSERIVSVRNTTLDSWCHEYLKGQTLSLIKVDTEGEDLSVLRGAAEVIREFKPFIIVEMRADIWDETKELFDKYYKMVPLPVYSYVDWSVIDKMDCDSYIQEFKEVPINIGMVPRS